MTTTFDFPDDQRPINQPSDQPIWRGCDFSTAAEFDFFKIAMEILGELEPLPLPSAHQQSGAAVSDDAAFPWNQKGRNNDGPTD